MQRLLTAGAALALAIASTSAAFAQPNDRDHHDDHRAPAAHGYVKHDWHNGGRIANEDWNRGARVDYRSHHLRAPPRGYEWRQVDGNYVLAAAATGVIASVLLANR